MTIVHIEQETNDRISTGDWERNKKNWMSASRARKIPQTQRKKFRTTYGPARVESQKGNPQTLHCFKKYTQWILHP